MVAACVRLGVAERVAVALAGGGTVLVGMLVCVEVTLAVAVGVRVGVCVTVVVLVGVAGAISTTPGQKPPRRV